MTIRALAAAMALAAVVRAAEPGAPPSPADALRSQVGPRVCRIIPRTEWGVPLGLASGFLLGNGRFVVTDLGVVGQTGTRQVELRFQDGSKATATQFALADPASGLAALQIDGDLPAREGLALAKEAAPPDGRTRHWAMGWKWATDLGFVAGTLTPGPLMRDLAGRPVEGGPPTGAVLRMAGGHLPAASGAPIVDAAGAVVAVRLDVLAQETLHGVAVPAAMFRETMLGSTPQLKPLSDLPTSMYLAAILYVPGEPLAPQALGDLARRTRAAMVCDRCKGTGEVPASLARGPAAPVFQALRPHRPRDRRPPRDWRPPADRPQDWRDRKVPCPECRGEKVVCTDAAYANLSRLAEECTRAAHAPGLAGPVRQAMRAEGTRMLTAVAQAGQRFQGEAASRASADLRMVGGDIQRGVVTPARVRETITRPDGRYTLLEPPRSRALLVIRADPSVDRATAAGALGSPKDLKDGTHVVIGGLAQEPLELGAARVVFLVPFAWVPLTEP